MLTKTAQKYVDLMVADITANPGDFKLSVSVNPRAYALSLIDGLDDGEVSQLIEYFHYEQRALRRAA